MESSSTNFKDISNNFKSEVWKHFHYSKQLGKGLCLKCNQILSAKGQSTKGLLDHLKLKHQIDLRSKKDEGLVLPSVKKMKVDTKIDKYLTGKQSDENLIAELVAVDRFSFNQISKSKPLRKGLKALGYEIPTTRYGVSKVFMKQFAIEKMKVANELKEFRDQGIRFSITLDESTNVSMKRLYNLNVHFASRFQSLGMMPVKGSCNAEKVVDLTKERLKLFNLDLDSDIVGATTDGAEVMKKFGRLIDGIHIICLSHGIHLAVCDVLYEYEENDFGESDSSGDEEEIMDETNDK